MVVYKYDSQIGVFTKNSNKINSVSFGMSSLFTDLLGIFSMM